MTDPEVLRRAADIIARDHNRPGCIRQREMCRELRERAEQMEAVAA